MPRYFSVLDDNTTAPGRSFAFRTECLADAGRVLRLLVRLGITDAEYQCVGEGVDAVVIFRITSTHSLNTLRAGMADLVSRDPEFADLHRATRPSPKGISRSGKAVGC